MQDTAFAEHLAAPPLAVLTRQARGSGRALDDVERPHRTQRGLNGS